MASVSTVSHSNHSKPVNSSVPSDRSTPQTPAERDYDGRIGEALKALVERYGIVLFGQSGRLRGLLQDECPQSKREISVLMQALDEHVPQDLMRVHSGEPILSLSPRLAKRLIDEKAMSPQASHWAVSTWAKGLGIELLESSDAMNDPVGRESQHVRRSFTPQDTPERFDGGTVYTEPAHQATSNGGRSPRVFMGLLITAVLLAAGGWFAFMQPKITIADVDVASVQGPLIGDGKPNPVQLSFEVRNTAPQSIEVRFVRGDGTWGSQPMIVKVGAGETGGFGGLRGTVPAGTMGLKTSKPAQATFSYVLVSRDGQRSAPFERSYEFVPPLLITGFDVPNDLRVGKPFNIGVKYQRGGSPIVQIERRIVQSTIPLTNMDASKTLKIDDETGQFNSEFEAPRQAFNGLMEFTLVDAQGKRSEPQRVAFNVAPAPPPPVTADTATASNRRFAATTSVLTGVVVSMREVRGNSGVGLLAGGATGAALGSRFGKGSGRTAATVGGALLGTLLGNTVESQMRGPSTWETVVKWDNGSLQTIQQTQLPPWQQGTRVKLSNGVIVASR